ncbi:MAG: universal stress protein, partial [Verrucomicrobiota bacterium]
MVRSSAPLLAWTRGERTLRVFVGCNFSIYAEAALRWVGELQKIGPCAVILGLVDRLSKERAELAIFDALHATEEVPEVATELHRELRATAQRILGIEPDTISVQPGSAQIDAHLVEMASATQADLLVIGTHRWHGLQRLAHPSISRHLLHDAPMSVACVPPKVRHGFPEPISEISRVLIAPDLSPQAEEIISMGYATLRGEGSACLFHNARAGEKPTPYEIEQRLRTLIPVEAGERGISTEIRICEDDDPVEALCQSADHFGADLVCVGSQTTMGGTTANAIVGASARPVLVVRTD